MSPSTVLIKACLNGARPAGSHPALPITPEEVARAAAAVAVAGAGAVHFHTRGPNGAESLAGADVAATVRAVRAACPGTPAGVTTGAWILRDTAKRFELVGAWTVLPDFASVNWSDDGSEELAQLLLDKGVGIEAGLFTVADAEAFAQSPLANRCLRALIEVRERDGRDPISQAFEMDSALERAGVTIPKLHHGFGEATWGVIEAALQMGRDVRIGLEDTFVLPDGRQARDNAELVAAVVGLGRAPGPRPAG